MKGELFINGKDTIIVNNFEANMGTKYLEKLQVKEYIFNIGSEIIVKKLEIIGDYNSVLNFWAYFWTSVPKFEVDKNSNYYAEYRFIHDIIRLSRTSKGLKLVVQMTAILQNHL